MRGLSFVFTPVETKVDKQNAAANKGQAKKAPVLTWRMSYANESSESRQCLALIYEQPSEHIEQFV